MNVRNGLLLLLTASIWGFAFVAQSVGMDYVGPFTFNFVRCVMGGLVLLPYIWLARRGKTGLQDSSSQAASLPDRRYALAAGGVCCGIALCLASNFQQFGIQYTTVGKAGFITACYIVLVPILGLFLKKTCGYNVWFAVLLALAGLYLLCMSGDALSIGKGDLLVLASSILFSVHILIIDYFSPRCDGVSMSCIQFFVCGLLSGAGMLLTEKPQISSILAAWAPLLYAGVMSCGVAYTLQIVGQKGMNPTVASLILSLESSISVLAGWLLLGQRLSGREILGCAIMFGAIILAQLPSRPSGRPRSDSRTANVRPCKEQ